MSPKHKVLLAIDGVVNLALGALLGFFPAGSADVLGLPPPPWIARQSDQSNKKMQKPLVHNPHNLQPLYKELYLHIYNVYYTSPQGEIENRKWRYLTKYTQQ